jgi:hypothetical protein
MITKQHFIRAAEIVRSIDTGDWTDDRPVWFVNTQRPEHDRAAVVAEAFIVLASEYNPRFDENRFLIACGLIPAPPKKARKSRTP